jgi:predicted ArsR family transcriptional regulator
MKNYTFRLTPTLLDQLQTNADAKGRTVSEYIRETLAALVLNDGKATAETKQHEATRKDAAQNTEAVLSDLSTVKKIADAINQKLNVLVAALNKEQQK